MAVRGRRTILALPVLLGLGGPAAARDQATGSRTVTPNEVRTWTFSVGEREWSARPAVPTILGDTGLFRLSTAETLPRGRLSFSLFRDNSDRDPKATDFSVHGFSLGFGLTDRLEIYGNVGVQSRAKAHSSDAGGPNEYPFIHAGWETGFGDVYLGLKCGLLDRHAGGGSGARLALRGFAKLPTADGARGLGTGAASFGADLILSGALGSRASLHGSVGYEWNAEPDPRTGLGPGNLVADAVRWGAGLGVPAGVFRLQVEVTGKVYGDSAFAQTSTSDLILGPVVWLGSGWSVRPAWSYAMGYDGRGREVSAGKRNGFQLAVGYHGGTRDREVYTPPPPPPLPPNRPPTVSVGCEPAPVPAEGIWSCRATATDPDGDPLVHSWSSGRGTIHGTTARARLDAAGISPGSCATVTVAVSDGRGGRAEATTSVCGGEADAPP